MIKKIVIPVRGDGKGDNVLAHAAALAHRFGAHVSITHCRPRPEDMIPYGVPIFGFMKKQMLEQATMLADQEEAGLEEEVKALCKTLSLNLTSGTDRGPATASWVEQPGKQVDVIKSNGRLADIICVAKPDVDRNIGTNTLRAALFHTGRPVMMCPERDTPIEALCDHIAVGWNGSLEASRAVAMTIGMLEQASKVTVLTSGSEVHGATKDDLMDYLSLRGIEPDIVTFDNKGSAGQNLLKHAMAAGADVLLMGAYGDSHEAETIFGGNTQAVVDNATLPVIFVH